MMPPVPSIDIEDVTAEITAGAAEARRAIARPQGPSPDDMARMLREATAREAWRLDRLSAE